MSEVVQLADLSDEVRALVVRAQTESIVLCDGNRQLAVLSSPANPMPKPAATDEPGREVPNGQPRFGSMKGRLTILVEDDEHRKDFC